MPVVRPPTPLAVVDYDARWPALFADEAARLCEALGDDAVGIEHVGSTAVPGLAAKPVIDILVGLRGELSEERRRALRRLGYVSRSREGRRYFRKGSPRTHFLHVVRHGGGEWRRRIDFRDYLRARPEAAAAYAVVKRELAARGDRAAYAAEKDAYIVSVRASAPFAEFLAQKRSPPK